MRRSTFGPQLGAEGRPAAVGAKQQSGCDVLAVITVLTASLVESPSRVPIGEFTLLGLLSLAWAVLAWFSWLTQSRSQDQARKHVWPLLVFLGWCAVSWTWSLPAKSGLQNLVVFVAFVGLIAVSANKSARSTGPARLLPKLIAWSALLPGGLYLICIVAYGMEQEIVSSRAFPLFALIPLAWFLANWRYGSRVSLLYASGLIVLIGLSLARTAFVVAFLLVALAQVQGRLTRGVRKVAFYAFLCAACLFMSVMRFEPLRERVVGDSMPTDIMEIEVRMSGRDRLWTATWDSYLVSPIRGNGGGSASSLLRERFLLDHPHNDYLRILHDYGAVGMVLWLAGMLKLLASQWRVWVRADREGRAERGLCLASSLATSAVLLVMITDNAFAYIFVMAPLGVLIGTSLGTATRALPQERRLFIAVPLGCGGVIARPPRSGTGGDL